MTAGANGFLRVVGGGSSRPAETSADFETTRPRPPLSTFTALVAGTL